MNCMKLIEVIKKKKNFNKKKYILIFQSANFSNDMIILILN